MRINVCEAEINRPTRPNRPEVSGKPGSRAHGSPRVRGEVIFYGGMKSRVDRV